MERRILEDEHGITMPLAIFTMVIIGVMGAGLLTFVMRDLDTVVETNRGQTSQEMADAGLEVAKRQLSRVDARPSQYDGDALNGESPWADDGSPMPLAFASEEATVGIRYLPPPSGPSETARSDRAPEVLPAGAVDGSADDDTDPDYPRERHYFRVTVEGSAGAGGETLRRFQGIYKTENYQLPVGYFATRDITIYDTATKINGISLFAERYIKNLNPAKKTGGVVKCGTLCGKDQAYGNWAFYPDATLDPNDGRANPYNRVPRATDDAGAAALGVVGSASCPPSSGGGLTYASTPENDKQKLRTANPQHYGERDFDRDSDQKCTGATLGTSEKPGFSANTWGDPANQLSLNPPQITYPFPTRDESFDTTMLNDLKAKAVDQGHYVRVDNGAASQDIEIDDGPGPKTPAEAVYPETNDMGTVVFVEFTGSAKGSVLYKAGRSGDLYKGTIVVVNGDLNTSSSSADYQGVFLVRDAVSPGSVTTESRVTTFNNGGSLDIDGYANVEGDLTLRGSVGGTLPGELLNGIAGLVSVDLWSLRECYDEGCS